MEFHFVTLSAVEGKTGMTKTIAAIKSKTSKEMKTLFIFLPNLKSDR